MYCPKNYAHDHSGKTGNDMQYFQQCVLLANCVLRFAIVVNDDVFLRGNFFIRKHTKLVN